MAGTIPLSMTQQFDEFGAPLKGGLLYIIQAGTVNTPQNPYQDYGLSVLQPNPMPLDAAGRVPQFFLADGFVKIQLTNSAGVIQRAQDGVLVVGPSSGGGGGGGVDPTALWQTGDMKARYDTAIQSGFVRANGRTMGNATSGGTERANTDTQALWIYLYNIDPNLAVSGGRTGNALNDYNANKTIATPDWRGCAIVGLDDMGNAAALRLTNSVDGFGAVATVLGALGGSQSNTLADMTKVPQHNHGGSTITDNRVWQLPWKRSGLGTTGSVAGAGLDYNDGTAPPTNIPVVSGTISNGVTGNAGGSAGVTQPHANVQPTRLCTIYLKL